MKIFLYILVGIFIFSPFVSSGIFNWWGNITGKAVSDTTTLMITVGNNAPTILNIQSIPAQVPRELDFRRISFNFNVTDADGVGNINDSSAVARFEKTGEVTRINNSCVWVRDYLPNTAEYSCSIDLWYYDGSGDWTINVSAYDINNAEAKNASTSFIYNKLTSMVMSPNTLQWDTLSLTDTNMGSNNDPIIVNNTGNDDGLSVNVTGRDLKGISVSSESIYAENFSVGVSGEGCGGDVIKDLVAVKISSAVLGKGNNSLNNKNASSGQEELFFCLKGLPQDISAQSYSSSGTGPWTIRVVS